MGQKDGQEDQGEAKELGGPLLAVLEFPGPSSLPSGSSLGYLFTLSHCLTLETTCGVEMLLQVLSLIACQGW